MTILTHLSKKVIIKAYAQTVQYTEAFTASKAMKRIGFSIQIVEKGGQSYNNKNTNLEFKYRICFSLLYKNRL